MKTCPHCAGTGLVHDDREVGAQLKKLREQARVTQRDVATSMGFRSIAHISDLEQGKRHWNSDRITAYLTAIGQSQPLPGFLASCSKTPC
jgi:predicted transcriptional regulator